jgi:TolB protein
MQKTLRSAAVVAAAAVVLAGCSSPTQPGAQSRTQSPPATQTAQPVAHSTEEPIQDVPWSQVGPGWTLAMWNAASPMNSGDEFDPDEPTPYNAETTLYLVSPEGGRYAITTFEAPDDGNSLPTLADWSGDGSRALFYRTGDDLTVI